MRYLNATLAALIIVAILLLISSDIALGPVNTTLTHRTSIENSFDNNEEPEGRDDTVNQEKVDVITETVIDGNIVIYPPRTPTIVDGTKKAITIRDRFIHGAVSQYGVTNSYNGAYKKLSYPNGDVDISTGVCTDVIVRAFRAVNIDLQQEIHRDMKHHFRKYPKKWGLTRPDPNIDHRRVPNMEVYFKRKGYKVPIAKEGDFSNYLPGDLVVWGLNNNLTHIGIVSDQKVPETSRYFIIHNPIQGVEISDWLVEFKIINHFRVFKQQALKS